MNQNNFNKIAGSIFLAVFLLHVFRISYSWEAVIGGVEIPLWVSWIALALSGLLVWTSFSLGKRR